MDESEALRVTVESLLNAADEDIGTGGPDPVRGIYPTVKKVTSRGIADVEDSRVKQIYESLVEKKKKGA
jgi:proteasome beta subunit